jgi:hypothetical protein
MISKFPVLHSCDGLLGVVNAHDLLIVVNRKKMVQGL